MVNHPSGSGPQPGWSKLDFCEHFLQPKNDVEGWEPHFGTGPDCLFQGPFPIRLPDEFELIVPSENSVVSVRLIWREDLIAGVLCTDEPRLLV